MKNKPKIRLFVDADCAAHSTIIIGPKQSHYLVHVMRMREGAPLLVFNGRDGEWQAEVAHADKKHTKLFIQTQTRQQTTSPDVWLCFAPVKNKNEVIIEKAVELGASRIIPVLTRYTVVRSLNEERMQARIVEAAEQCGRLDIPVLESAKSFNHMLEEWPEDRTLFFADERGQGEAYSRVLAQSLPAKKAMLIGPEGGFSEEEQQVLYQQAYVKAFSLGPRILRADTAAIAALSCMMAWQGDWNEQPCYPTLAAGTKTS